VQEGDQGNTGARALRSGLSAIIRHGPLARYGIAAAIPIAAQFTPNRSSHFDSLKPAPLLQM